jgi:tripartite-type tricarboxylate transporter receptor subunit TctC
VIRLRRQQWIAAAKEKPGTLTVGTSSAGTTNYLAALLFKSMQNLDFTVVPYRGPSELTVALLRNDVDLVINSYGGLPIKAITDTNGRTGICTD